MRLALGNRVEERAGIIAVLLGIALLALLAALPVIGWLINALAAFLGLGAILTLILRQLEKARQRADAPQTPPSDAPLQIPPPMVEDHLLGPGMDNLPDGFKWWD
jgi:hypothetical protein